MKRFLMMLAGCAALAVNAQMPSDTGTGSIREALGVPVKVETSPVDPRVAEISRQLRCLVCQNENVAESATDFAVGIRTEIAGLIAKGETDDAIIDHMASRYGEYILYKPVFAAKTLLLWFAPLILLVLAALAWAVTVMRRRENRSSVKDAHVPGENQAWSVLTGNAPLESLKTTASEARK